MNIKKIYNYFFYLNTGARVSGKETTIISSYEAFVITVFGAILKKVFFSNLKVNSLFVFTCFLIVCIVLNYFNQKTFKRQNGNFVKEWMQESNKSKIVFKIYNVAFIIIVFYISIYVLSCFD